MAFWILDGALLCDDTGRPIDCETCPCGCSQCTEIGREMQIEFLADLNLNGTCANCDEWVAAWTLSPLPPNRIAELFAAYPATFPGARATDFGCWFGLFLGLPCGADFMVGEIQGGGSTGYAIFVLTIGWADGTFVRLQFTHAVSPASSNCIDNFTRASEAVEGCNVGYSSGGSPPCDFLQLYFPANCSNVVLTMVA
jgi:hypothetical protein